MVDGIEYDGAFVDTRSITVFEFTTSPKKDKAEKDGRKIAVLLKRLRDEAGNQFKSAQGYFVTQLSRPLEQRGVIGRISRETGEKIHCMSILQLTNAR